MQPDIDTAFLMVAEENRAIIDGLNGSFKITWARERSIRSTKLTVLILQPDEDISLTFGFKREIALFISGYSTVQPRTAQAIEDICSDSPLLGRVDPSVVFLHSADPSMTDWVQNYLAENPQSRTIVPFTQKVLLDGIDDRWAIKNNIKNNLFIRNLFDYKLPLQSDIFFMVEKISHKTAESLGSEKLEKRQFS